MTNNFIKLEKIAEGLRKSLQNADYKMANRPCYGYMVDIAGEFAIHEAEAAIVR